MRQAEGRLCFLAFFDSQVGDEHLRKQHRSLAELHYSKAVCLFLSLRDAPCELLRTLLERVAFAEFTMAGEEAAHRGGRCFVGGWRTEERVSPPLLSVMLHVVCPQVRAAVWPS